MSVVSTSKLSDPVLGRYLVALAWDPHRLRPELAKDYDDSLAQMNNCLVEAANEWVYSHNQEAKGGPSHTDSYPGILGVSPGNQQVKSTPETCKSHRNRHPRAPPAKQEGARG